MSKWPVVRLGDVCYLNPSKTEIPTLDKELEVSFVPMVDLQAKQIYFEVKETKKLDEVIKGYTYFRNNDVLLAKITPCFENGKSGIATNLTNGIGFGSTEFIVLRPGDQILPEWIYYCIANNNFLNAGQQNMTGTAGQQRVSQEFLKRYGIPLPPLEVQKEIAQTLGAAAEMIGLRKKQLAELDNLVKAVFYDMFGDPVINDKGWKINKLGNLGELARGISKHRPRNDPKLLGGAYPLIQTGDVANAGLYITEYKQTYSEIGLKQSKMWDKGTLCITIAANIAETAILGFDACFPDSIVGFNPGNLTNAYFINFWFSFFQKIIEDQAPESAQKNINLRILNDLDVIVPPLALQNEFAAVVAKVEEQKVLVQKAIGESQYLFDSLMSEYFG